MKILKYILLAIAWLGSEQIASSQYYLKLKSDSVSLESDSALIFIDEYRGVINWQTSSDLVNWLSVNKNNDTLGVRIDSSAYYRATIIEGNCNPVMSDTAFIIEKVTITGSNQFTVDSLGGIFLLPNGIKVKIPKGAVTEPGEIKLDILGFDDAIALSDINISENTTFLSGISFSTDLFDFSKSIKIKIPLQNIDKTGLPVLYELQNENSTWFFSDETLIVSPEDKFIEVILKASVKKGSSAKKGSKGSLNDVRSFFLKLYGDIFLSEDECRTKGYKIISKNIDNSAGQGCDAVRVHEDIVYYGCDPEQSGGSVGLVLSADCEPKLTIIPEGEKKVKKGESLPITLSTSISGFRLSDQKININTSPNLNVLNPLIFTDSNGDKAFDVTGIAAGNGEITLSVSYDYFLTTIYASSNEEMEYQEYDNVKIKKDYTINVTVYDVPEVSTAISSDIACTTETVGGKVESDGGEEVTDRGVYWGTSENPELTGTKVSVGDGTGSFSTILTGLNPKTTYYVKAYATNLSGTAFGYEIAFTTGLDKDFMIESTSHHLGDNAGNEGVSFTKTFLLGDLDCYTTATLSISMNGPNSAQPPIVTLNNYILPSVLRFLPSFSFPCWVKNEDKSYDYNCSYSYTCEVLSFLTFGTNTINIRNGRPDDDYYFSNIEITFLSSD